MLATGAAQAASVSYDLTLSNDPWNIYIPDGTAYAQVTIDDNSGDGLINFTVTILDSILSQSAGPNFGLQSFGFNAVDGSAAANLGVPNIVGLGGGALPTGWSADVNHYVAPPPGGTGIALDGWGKFDAAVSDGGSNRLNPTLTFSVDLADDAISDYIVGSDGGANGSLLFAAHIVGFNDLNPNAPADDPYDGTGLCYDMNPPDENWTLDCNILTSTWVSGGTQNVIPVPAAAWLFGSALCLLGWVRRRAA